MRVEIRAYEEELCQCLRMRDLAAILRKKRMKRGSIDFDFRRRRSFWTRRDVRWRSSRTSANVATKIIEDFMLLANETVAQDYSGRNCRLCTMPTRTRIRRKS